MAWRTTARGVVIIILAWAAGMRPASAIQAAAATPAPRATANLIVIDPDGRTLELPTRWDEDEAIVIEVRVPIPVQQLITQREEIRDYNRKRCRLRLNWRWQSEIRDPDTLNEERSVPSVAEQYPHLCKGAPLPETETEKKQAQQNEESAGNAVWPITFTIPRGSGRMLAYNLWRFEPRAADVGELQNSVISELTVLFCRTVRASHIATSEKRAVIQKELNTLEMSQQTTVDRTKAALDQATEALARLEQEGKLFTGAASGAAGDALVQIWREIRVARAGRDAAKAAADDAKARLEAIHQAQDDLKELDAARASQQVQCGRLALLKAGALLPSNARKTVFYDFVVTPAPAAPPGFSLLRMTDYPHLVDDDELYAIVTNRRLVEHPHGFTLSATKETGLPPNLTPIRPTFDSLSKPTPVAGSRALPADRATPATCTAATLAIDEATFETAYVDSILPFEDPLKGNQILKVTISTYAKRVTTDKNVTEAKDGKPTQTDTFTREAAVVDLLKDVAYPQVHQRYYFNFVSGVVVSSLKSRSVRKVPIAVDVPDTKDVNEARYRLDESDGAREIMPAFVFSVHPFGVDLHERVWDGGKPSRRMIPGFAAGFSITDPRNNVLLGTTTEIYDNIHVFVGVHRGKQRERVVTTNDAGELVEIANTERDSSEPATRDVTHWKLAWGFTFNIDLVTKIFGK